MVVKYFSQSTNSNYYDSMIKNPSYFKKAKGKKFTIKLMSPDQYMKEVAKQQKTSVGFQYERIEPKLVKKYKEMTLAGSPMSMLTIESTEHYTGQEGRHRAMVAKELGVKKVPVMIIEDMKQKEWENYMKKYFPDVWRYMS